MNLNQISIKNFILALFKRDDGERILLGSGAYEFDADLQHFAANIIANDVIEKQGTDGQLLAGQVRRSAPQSFDGYVGDATTTREDTENYRRTFIRFFQPRHFYTVIYILPDGNAIQRKNGYLTDAPAVPEQYQKSPRYHVALAFEDLNYYSYAEDAQGDETYAQTVSLQPESELTGGLVWDATPGLKLSQIVGKTQLSGTPTPSTPAIFQKVQGIQTITIDGVNYTLNLSGAALDGIDDNDSYIYKTGGAWKLHRAVENITLAGVSWTVSSWSSQKRIYITLSAIGPAAKSVPNNDTIAAILSDRYKTTTLTALLNQTEDKCIGLSSSGYLSIRDSSKASAADLINEIDNNNPSLYYALATPVESTITNANLIAQLNAIEAALMATTTAPTISTTSANALPATISTSTGTSSDGIVWTAETAGGKNLAKTTAGIFAYSTFQTYAITGGEITSSRNTTVHQGGSFNMQTGATSQWTAGCIKDCHLTPDGGTYTITAIRDGAFTPRSGYSPRIAAYVVIYDGQGNETHSTLIETSTNATESLTLTLDPDKHIGCLIFYCQYCSFTDLKFKVQLEQGNDSTAYERFIPLGGAVWDAETGHATTTFTVNGLYAVNPIWTVPGPAESPLIENTTNGTSLSYLGQIPAGQSLIIDCGNQTATLAGANVKNNVRGTWQTFEPGQITIRYSGANITGPSNLKWNEVVG